MKKFLIVLLFAVSIGITSCGYETPVIDGKDPFIVTGSNICEYAESLEGMSKYYSSRKSSGLDNFFGSWKPCIIAPTGKYATGDTITFKK